MAASRELLKVLRLGFDGSSLQSWADPWGQLDSQST